MISGEDLNNALEDMLHPAWGHPAWPAKFTGIAEHQKDAIRATISAYRRGVQVILLDAPTGSGKTVIAEAVRRLTAPKQSLYVAHNKGLMDQFMADFGGYAKALKGRSNYPTLDRPELADDPWEPVSCGDCMLKKETIPACGSCHQPINNDPDKQQTALHCQFCHPWIQCPYQMAKREAMQAPLTVTNTSYFVTEANGPGGLSKRPFVIVDECDTLEPILLGHASVDMSARRRKQYDIGVPQLKTREDTWLPWVTEDALPKILTALNALGEPHTPKEVKERTYLERTAGKLQNLARLLEQGNAVYDGYKDDDVKFKPVRVSYDAPGMLWKHSERWLCMSATIIDPTEFVEGLGIDETDLSWELVTVPMTFPVENRPIIVKPVANMVYKEKDTEWPKMVEGIRAVLHKHPTDRILVHTVSYAFAQYCHDRLRKEERQFYVYSSAKEREYVLENFRRAPGAVLLAPSMDRGVDLPHDDCRVVVVTKMPFVSLGDKQVTKRLYGKGGQLWYAVQTIRSLVQMTGRHVRSKDDVGITYILDRQFVSNVWKKSRHLLPQYWRDALDMTGGGLEVPTR